MMAGAIHHHHHHHQQQQLLSSFVYANEAEEDDWKKRKASTSTSSSSTVWKEYFRDPSKWWDNRNSKPSPRHPDFQHKVTRQPLWMDSRDTPSWVIQELRSRSRGDPSHVSKTEIDAFVASLRACTRNKDLVTGVSIHDDLVQRGLLEKCSRVLVIMYAKCGELGKAKELLDMYKSSNNVVTWTALIAGYAQDGHSQNALECFEQMQREGILPDAVTYTCILKACATIGDVDKGKQIHDEIARQGLLQNDIVLGGALVDMYAKCGAVSKARRVLDGLPARNVVCWSALIAGYAREGLAKQALDCFEEMQREGILPDAVTYACILKACAMIGAADKGKQIHEEISKQGLLQNNIVLGNSLVDMYAKCGAISKARQVLDGLPSRDVVSWSALIAGYAQEGHAKQALDCFEEMQGEGILPDAVTYACILKACATIGAVDKGKQIHDAISRQGLLQNNSVLGNALVDMYAKWSCVSNVRQVLNGLPSRDVVSWNALIAGYVQAGHAKQALDCSEEMQLEGICPDAVTFVCILKACAMIGAADKGKQIHDEIARHGLLQNYSVLGNALVDMYAKCGAVSKARQVLEGLPFRDVVSWNALIAGYAQAGPAKLALDCFEEMQCEDILPDAVTYMCMMKACATIGAVDKGKQIHDEIARRGLLQNNIVLGNAVVDMYAKCGAVLNARQVLDGLPCRDVISWNALIAGYAQKGHANQALDCSEDMQHEGILPDAVTFICILKACAMLGAADKGKQIHDEIARQGLLQNDIVLGSALVDMYAKCGAVLKARQVLDGLPSRNVVCWNALIAGYAQEGHSKQALDCFEEMQCEGILPDAVTYLCILKACAVIGAADKGKQIHDEIARKGLLQDDIALGNAVVDMYAKSGVVSKARQVLDGLRSRDVVSWNALIAGYAKEGHAKQALDCFEEMQQEGILPDAVTYVCILKACATIGAADKGKQIHDEIGRQGLLQNNTVLGNALVDMYAKCGAVSKARQVLNGLPCRDVVSWSVLIAGYVQEGYAEQALDCFEEMRYEGILPDAVTCACVLNVCSHRGLIEEGEAIFVDMSTKYGVNPSLECYTCMVDLLGRAGQLEKAVRLIQDMPSSDHSIIWHTLLGACRKWADVNVGRWAFERAVQLDKSDGPAYVLMADIYATAGMGQKAKDIEFMRIRNTEWKKPGCSVWIDSSNAIHEFSVGDTTHAQSKRITAKLEDIAHKMSQQGYSPSLNRVSQDISNAAKAHLFCDHSEKGALACALINTTSGEKQMLTCAER